ncbi:MAG: sodium-dependent transporter [Eubacterium sp.]|nr:sodium-dependent transporter [Eubacterium sp.]
MEQTNQKGQWGSKFGFLMAAVGSAVGLGNLWGFPYKMGVGGGFAFLLIYLVMVALVGVVILLAELALGRKTGKGVIASYRELGNKYTFIGWMSWLSPVLILGFYSMLGGYCIKYAVANIGDLFGASWGVNGMASADYFHGFYTDPVQTVAYTVLFVFLTVFIVRVGVSKGIEKFSTVAMPALFVMLVIIIVRSVTLPGASEGLAFVFKPNFDVFKGTGWITVLAKAGGQMFFSLSLGMAIMVTYGSYMKKDDDLQQNAVIIPIADTIIAVMAGMAIMPAVFASGLDPAGGPGLLFITLQTVFQAMGSLGPIFGFMFYTLVFIAAITSSISLVEAVSSAIMDRAIAKNKPVNRTKISMAVGVFVALEGALVAVDGLGENGLPHILGQGTLLDAFDLVSEGLFMPIAALLTAIIFGWIKPGWLDDEVKNLGETTENSFKMKSYFQFCIKWIVPPVMLLVLAGQVDSFFGLGWFN